MLYKFDCTEEAESRKKLFVTWMMFERDIKASMAIEHARILDAVFIRQGLKNKGMNDSIFLCNSPMECMAIAEDMPIFINQYYRDRGYWRNPQEAYERRFRRALGLYVDWLKNAEIFTIGDFRGMMNRNEHLSGELEQTLLKLKKLSDKLEVKNAELSHSQSQLKETKEALQFLQANPPMPDINHEKLVAEIFCEISNRYMECMKNKTVEQRHKIKESLLSIMNELDMDEFVPKDMKKCIRKFDDERAPAIPQLFVNSRFKLENINIDKNFGAIVGKSNE